MDVYHALLNQISQEQVEVKQAVIGLHWTVVVSQFAGMASTLPSLQPHHDSPMPLAGRLIGQNAVKLTDFIVSKNTLLASLGLAGLNSLLSINPDQCEKINAFDVIKEKGKQKKVAVIGHFPFVEKLKNLVGDLIVFEKNPRAGDRKEQELPDMLPTCDVIGITATSIINHSFEHIMKFCDPNAYKIMLGPSTPMTPVLFDFGLDLLAGTKIVDSARLIRFIIQGATFKQVAGVEVIAMRKTS